MKSAYEQLESAYNLLLNASIDVRAAQHLYAKTRAPEDLAESKMLEKMLDVLLRERHTSMLNTDRAQLLALSKHLLPSEQDKAAKLSTDEWLDNPVWFAAGWLVKNVAYTVVCAEDGSPVSAVRRQGDQYRSQSCAVQIIAIREAQRIAFNYWQRWGAPQEPGLQGYVKNHDITAVKIACNTALASAGMTSKANSIGKGEEWAETMVVFSQKDQNHARMVVQKWAETNQSWSPNLNNKYTKRLERNQK
tara:strand:+ start:1440 stop:2183 length:744 start_codon:yes stop_codon:yes gene_type:complete